MWAAPANPLRFNEAIAWFRARVPLTDAQLDELTRLGRRRAFTVAGVAHLNIVRDVWRALDAAVTKGTTLAEFRKATRAKLEREWGRSDSQRIETIFRTNVQMAYSSGRHQQLTDPAVKRARPFWLYDAILDDRTTPICKECHGTLLPADHEFWSTHTPPLHFRCRSGIRSLRESQAKARGGVTAAPTTEPPAGFGGEPQADEWKPAAANYPSPIWKAYEAKTKFTVGKHAKQLDVEANAESKATLEAIADGMSTLPSVLTLLLATPIAKLKIGTFAKAAKNGHYVPSSGELLVVANRRPETFGRPLNTTTWSISSVAKTKREAELRTFVHEVGHHLHFSHAAIDRLASTAYRAAVARWAAGDNSRATELSKKHLHEYFAEAFAAYYFERDHLRRSDPDALSMVEKALQILAKNST